MGQEFEGALQRLQSTQHVDGTADPSIEREAREVVLAVLDAGLRDPRPDAVEIAQLGSMLLVRHPGASDPTWVATADALRRIVTAVGLDPDKQDQ